MEQPARRTRIADVAREAGVSKTAVSFAFNSPDRLRPETASRIREVAETLGYRPHPVARMLTQRQTMTIGVLTPQALSVIFSNPFFGAFAEGVALAAEQSGYALHFISPLHGSLAHAMNRATVDGVVAVGLSAHHPEVEQLGSTGLPLVLVDSTAMPNLPSVSIDDEGGARAAADHLLDLGHEAVAVAAIGLGPTDPPGAPDSVGWTRIRGYRSAFERRGLELPPESIFAAPASIEGGVAAFRDLWKSGRRVTGVLAMSDAMAIGVIAAAHGFGLRVPDDLSVVGFDDIDIAQHTNPPLTTVHQPIRQKGEEAIRLLLSLVERPHEGGPDHRRLETRLIVRGSTGPAPR